MRTRIPQSVAIRVPLKAYLSTDHVSVATGKTIAVVISKNGGSFGNPNAGATNATEIASGWYYVDLGTADTGTAGPLIVRGTASGVDDVEVVSQVVDAHNAGFDGVPSATAGAANGLSVLNDVIIDSVNDGTPASNDFNGTSALSSSNDFYNGCVLVFTSGTLQGIARKVSAYVGSTRTLQFTGSTGAADAPFPTSPANADTFVILGRIG